MILFTVELAWELIPCMTHFAPDFWTISRSSTCRSTPHSFNVACVGNKRYVSLMCYSLFPQIVMDHAILEDFCFCCTPNLFNLTRTENRVSVPREAAQFELRTTKHINLTSFELEISATVCAVEDDLCDSACKLSNTSQEQTAKGKSRPESDGAHVPCCTCRSSIF